MEQAVQCVSAPAIALGNHVQGVQELIGRSVAVPRGGPCGWAGTAKWSGRRQPFGGAESSASCRIRATNSEFTTWPGARSDRWMPGRAASWGTPRPAAGRVLLGWPCRALSAHDQSGSGTHACVAPTCAAAPPAAGRRPPLGWPQGPSVLDGENVAFLSSTGARVLAEGWGVHVAICLLATVDHRHGRGEPQWQNRCLHRTAKGERAHAQNVGPGGDSAEWTSFTGLWGTHGQRAHVATQRRMARNGTGLFS
jgi:hypothetical protein